MDQKINEALSPYQRIRVAWMIAWISFVLDAVLWLVMLGARHYLDSRSANVIYTSCTVLILLIAAPWIVQLVVRANFSDFHLVAVRDRDGRETRKMSYFEGLSVVWLIIWRLVVVVNVVVIGSWLLLRIPLGPFATADQGEPGLKGFVELVIDNALVLPLLYFWLVPAAFGKRYSGFVLQARRTG